jgi:hypothetical protein
MALPVSGAFADSVESVTQNAVDSSITVAQEAGDVSIMSVTWTVNTATNMRATPSPTGAWVASLYPGAVLSGGRGDSIVVNGVTWVGVTSYSLGVSGYVQLSALEETG